MSGSNEQNQPRFKKRTPNHDGPSAPKVKGKCGGSYHGVMPTYSTCGMNHFGKCLVGTENCFGCGKDGHNVNYFPNISAIGREFKKDPPRVVEESRMIMMPLSYSFLSCVVMGSL